MKSLINYFLMVPYLILFIGGFIVFKLTGKTPKPSYISMRRLFLITNGYFNDFTSFIINIFRPKYQDISSNGILGTLNRQEIKEITNDIRENGYHVFNVKLSNREVERLLTYARQEPLKPLEVETGRYGDPIVLDENQIISPRYQFESDQLFSRPEICAIVFDKSILAIAQEYLGCKPILDLIAMWWSFPFEGKGSSAAAQLYHFDMDRIKFIKFFFYLTDVGPNNGPHCYIKKSHRRLPKQLRSDGRKTDDIIHATYSSENIMELQGEKGQIIAVDTRGLHKGKILIDGHRLLFQVEFTNSLFGKNYPKVHHSETSRAHISDQSNYLDTYSKIFN